MISHTGLGDHSLTPQGMVPDRPAAPQMLIHKISEKALFHQETDIYI